MCVEAHYWGIGKVDSRFREWRGFWFRTDAITDKRA